MKEERKERGRKVERKKKEMWKKKEWTNERKWKEWEKTEGKKMKETRNMQYKILKHEVERKRWPKGDQWKKKKNNKRKWRVEKYVRRIKTCRMKKSLINYKEKERIREKHNPYHWKEKKN